MRVRGMRERKAKVTEEEGTAEPPAGDEAENREQGSALFITPSNYY